MVVTSKALGFALLSALALAAPFEDSATELSARSADAIADALLIDEFDLAARDAEPEADFDDELIAREAEPEFEFDDEAVFVSFSRYVFFRWY